MAKPDIYQKVTEEILKRLDQGTIPWRKPWYSEGLPISWKTGKSYNGTNLMLLEPGKQYITYLQAKEAGGNIKKGVKGIPIIYAQKLILEDKEKDQDDKSDNKKNNNNEIVFLKHYTVFQVGRDTEGIELRAVSKPEISNDPIIEAEQLLKNYQEKQKIEIAQDGGNRAFYRPSTDSIHLPRMEVFHSSEEFYATALHEVVHSTGHKSRLNRLEITSFGSEKYGKEELVAEFGSAMLCDKIGISPKTIDNQAAYIQNWSKAIKQDKNLVVRAATKAMEAADFVLGIERYQEQNQNQDQDKNRIEEIKKVRPPKSGAYKVAATEYKWQAKENLSGFSIETDKKIIANLLMQGFDKLKLQGVVEKYSPIKSFDKNIESMKEYSKNLVKSVHEKVKDKINSRGR